MQRTWKDRAMIHSEAITDAWEVTKAFAARLAEWILFICMILNIIEILPGVGLSAAVSNAVLAVQAVTLDIAGFGLTSMADHAQNMGDTKNARKGHRTGWFLIGLMIATLLLTSAGLLWPMVQQYTEPAEKVLLLARVVMTVIYSHVVHSLRHSSAQTTPATPTAASLDYQAIAQQLQAITPPAPAPHLDLQELAQQVVALLPKPAEEEAILQRLEPIIRATVQVALEPRACQSKSGAGATSQVALEPPRLLALEPSRKVAPKRGTGATPRSHKKSGYGASRTVDSEPPETRLQIAYRELAAEGGHVSGRALAAKARCNRATATEWLQSHASAPVSEPEEALA
jgi:hypothetical protein